MFTENLFNSHLQTEEEREIQTCTVRHKIIEVVSLIQLSN